VNALDLADFIDAQVGEPTATTAMLRAQHEAIKVLREALESAIADSGYEMSDGWMDSAMHSTSYHAAKAALAATETLT
jgi:hypothetical protein